MYTPQTSGDFANMRFLDAWHSYAPGNENNLILAASKYATQMNQTEVLVPVSLLGHVPDHMSLDADKVRRVCVHDESGIVLHTKKVALFSVHSEYDHHNQRRKGHINLVYYSYQVGDDGKPSRLLGEEIYVRELQFGIEGFNITAGNDNLWPTYGRAGCFMLDSDDFRKLAFGTSRLSIPSKA